MFIKFPSISTFYCFAFFVLISAAFRLFNELFVRKRRVRSIDSLLIERHGKL